MLKLFVSSVFEAGLAGGKRGWKRCQLVGVRVVSSMLSSQALLAGLVCFIYSFSHISFREKSISLWFLSSKSHCRIAISVVLGISIL